MAYTVRHDATLSKRSLRREGDRLQRLLPLRSPHARLRRYSLRSVLGALFYLLRTGCPWRYLPANFTPWQTVYYHFRQFYCTGLWTHLWRELRTAERRRLGKDAPPSAAIMDSQSVRTVEESARIRGYDAHKSVKGRKRHLLVDTLGLPITSYVTPADVHDTVGAQAPGGPCAASATAPEDLGGRRVSGEGVGGVVPAAGRLGPRGGEAYTWGARLQRPTTRMGGGTLLRLVDPQPADGEGLRAHGPDQRDPDRSGHHPHATPSPRALVVGYTPSTGPELEKSAAPANCQRGAVVGNASASDSVVKATTSRTL